LSGPAFPPSFTTSSWHFIKGYVYSIAQPQPLVQDLEHWAPEMAEATTAYGLISDNWYVFVVRH
jgi:hypothetical protein